MSDIELPDKLETEEELDELLSRPTPATIKALSQFTGDILVLGVGGKMGPTLARLLKRATDETGLEIQIVGVSRFSSPHIQKKLDKIGIKTISSDLLMEGAIDSLPELPFVIYMVGRKFGTGIDSSHTWAANTFLSALVARKFKDSKIVVFSTGNVYPLLSVQSGGATESTPLDPIGEYAQTCLGRERIFEYFCHKYGTNALFFRLNYAIDLRYGVLLDIAQKVFYAQPIDLRMGFVNVIWQGDANNYAAQALAFCENPPISLNVTGSEIISIQWLANQFGQIMNKSPIFKYEEQETALLSNASKCHQLLGDPQVPLDKMINWVAHWVTIGGPTLNKPTNFEIRNGRF